MDSIKGKLALIKMYCSEIECELKRMNKEKKIANSLTAVRKGIHKPVHVSPLLLSFMGLPENNLVSRTDFNSFLSKYIKTNQLVRVSPVSGKKEIIPDAVILPLMDKTKQVPAELTYFNMQGFFNHLFYKAIVP
jgi:hypothetical protein